ncbi:MAG: hypothetical protein M3P18_24930 [Actinomycetota bacterium]|nr:hypothetical protein [Actinomycetota bacterium]
MRIILWVALGLCALNAIFFVIVFVAAIHQERREAREDRELADLEKSMVAWPAATCRFCKHSEHWPDQCSGVGIEHWVCECPSPVLTEEVRL